MAPVGRWSPRLRPTLQPRSWRRSPDKIIRHTPRRRQCDFASGITPFQGCGNLAIVSQGWRPGLSNLAPSGLLLPRSCFGERRQADARTKRQERAFRAFRAAGDADPPAVMDQPVAKIDPFLFGEEGHQVLLDFCGVS